MNRGLGGGFGGRGVLDGGLGGFGEEGICVLSFECWRLFGFVE